MTALEMLNGPHVARLTVCDFTMLAKSGAFAQYAKAELIEGEIIVVNAQFRRHAACRRKLVRAFEDALAGRSDGIGVLDECSVAFDDASMPQPDIVLTTEPEGEGPIPLASVRLLVEVADTTLAQDLGRKLQLYAAHGVPEYWVVDLNENRVLCHAHPRADGSGYDGQVNAPFGETLQVATVVGLMVETAGLD